MFLDASSQKWLFDEVVQSWFDDTFSSPTGCQKAAWSALQAQRDVLVSAPTGSGKTLAAFLAVIDELVREGLEKGAVPVETRIVYISPLKALSYDIEKNLRQPLCGIHERLTKKGYRNIQIRTAVRTGDTTQYERQKMTRNPPHILVTTPESLYLLLTAESGRRMLQTARTLIVDEIHALASNKRGAHLSLSVTRLEMLIQGRTRKIGLSATQKPVDSIASFLTGRKNHECCIVDMGHLRTWDLAIEVPSTPLESVMSTAAWAEVHQKLVHLIKEHRTTLIFVNTRRHVERVTRHLAEILGEEHVGSHHGSLSKEHRHQAEQKLKSGSLRALVATASLELGIDIGDVDLVCQLCSPRSISVFLQRVGRSGHAVGKIPKGRLFPSTRDELVESAALLKSIRNGELESLEICYGSSDVLAQQIVAEACTRECDIDELHSNFRKAYPYRRLEQDHFHKILQMLADGFTLRRGRQGSYIHLDAVNRKIRGKRGARIAAATNAGVIPDLFDYDVILEPDEIRIGTINEDFAFESLVGDIFQLGNASYRIRQVTKGKVRVEDAKGLPPNIPFWLGEGRGRSCALSQAVSDLRHFVDESLERGELKAVIESFRSEYELDDAVAAQIVNYLAAGKRSLGILPTQDRIVYERFFDETGDMHLVIHSIFGSRLNRAWGLTLRKRFCVRFNFELQAAALEDNFVLSLGPTHSFALEEVQNYVKSSTARDTLVQAIFAAPMFATRWRWAANTALAVLRFRYGKKVPPPFQRNDSEDLLSLVFPDQVACQENLTGPIEVPEHPLVEQTIYDCLHDLMDINGFENLLEKIENQDISVHCRDLPEPSPLAHEILTAKPYAFLDDAPAEERRTLAVQTRRFSDASDLKEYSGLDSIVIRDLQKQAWPNPRNAAEMHDALVNIGFVRADEAHSRSNAAGVPDQEGQTWVFYLNRLTKRHQATKLKTGSGSVLWVSAERLDELLLLHPDSQQVPKIQAVTLIKKEIDGPETALKLLLQSRLETLGPCTRHELSSSIDVPQNQVETALLMLESEGSVMRGRFLNQSSGMEWCDRRFLARIHKKTIKKLRNAIQPVSQQQYVQYLFQWMRFRSDDIGEGIDALDSVLGQLEAYESPSAVWESDLLPPRIFGYTPELLDYLSASGKIVWTRLSRPSKSTGRGRAKKHRYGTSSSIKTVPLTFLKRTRIPVWNALVANRQSEQLIPSPTGQMISEALDDYGPMFFDEMLDELNQLPTHLEQGLVELFALGIATCDHFGGIRALLTPERLRRRRSMMRRISNHGVQNSGRWSLINRTLRRSRTAPSDDEILNCSAQVLLRRYGIVFSALLTKENKIFPSWRELRSVYRRMEDRGEVRGGRFVNGVVGEQFALPHAVELLRATKNYKMRQSTVTVHAADPLNLTGVMGSETRVAALNRNYLVYRNGSLLNVIEGGQKRKITPLE